MKRKRLAISLSIIFLKAGWVFALILIAQPVQADLIKKTKENIQDIKKENSQQTKCLSLQIKNLKCKNINPITPNSIEEFPHPVTSAESLLVQSSVVQVTNVQLNSMDDGIEVILETAGGETLQVVTTSKGNSLIIDIPNAQLDLPQGKEFRQEKPFSGIASVNVAASGNNSIQVIVTGVDGVPTGEILQNQPGLVVSVTPPETAGAEDADIEIIVTAEKTPEDLQNVPISITALTEEELEDAQIDSLQGIANNTPNFSIFSQGGRTFTYYNIRGLGNNGFSGDSVAFYIDDVPFDSGRFIDLDLIDLERVEVLRGPQNTLYGRNTQGGVVNIITKLPTNIPESRIGASYGNYNSRNLQYSFSGAVIPDKLSLRFSGNYEAQDGFYKNTFLDENVGKRFGIAGRGQLLWQPSDEWTISFNTFGSYNDDEFSPFSFFKQSDPFKIEQDFIGYNELSTNAQALKIAYNGSAFRTTSVTTRRFSNQFQSTDGDVSPAPLARYINEFNSTVWTQEIRFQSPLDSDQFRWLFGGYYESYEYNTVADGFRLTEQGASAFGFPAPGTDRASGELYRNTYAVFGQVDYKPVPSLTLTAGLRYESNKTRLDRRRNYELAAGGSFPIGETVNDVEQNSDELIPRLAVEYRFNPNLMIYTSITRGYKPGGLNYRADTEVGRPFEEETSWNYEVGLKSSWFDNRLTANLAVFNTQVDNYQVPLPDISGQFRNIVNAGVSITGFELELKAEPIDGFNLITGFGYIDGKFTDYTNPFTGQNFNGNRLTYTPKFTYNLAAQYRSPGGGIFARMELQGFGTYFFDDANEIQQDPFALVNARIGYEGKNYGVYLFANNIFDTEYVTSAFAFPPRILASYGNPVTYGIQVRASF
uniref:TonB-dependent receptor n=1 Tax=Fischerella sp. MV11 TaxID=397321 RepID=E1U3M2_9CYAN|nr:TonB-dependent receptor [Fischerella sp. MV11]